ncbi:MAG: hypothetical protein FJ145_10805 [Deltaproteobacteria bacterium]|nr:hypothetical protein [Deltaproteobacteria bacterium]
MARPHASNNGSKQLFFSHAYEHYFPDGEFGGYDAFLNAGGESVKSERRTHVVVQRRPSGSPRDGERAFVIKSYYYPFFPSIRTGFQKSKAEREYLGLAYLKQAGLSAAEPVAFGSARSWLGLVQSCFVITIFVEGSINLAQWRKECTSQPGHNWAQSAFVVEQIGSMFRRLHEERFFLFATKPKNILIRHASTEKPELFFIDVPYSRSVRWNPVARWAQARDLGMFLGNFYPALTERETAAFYQGYLPDPLGGSESLLHTQVDRVTRSTQHRTPLKAVFYPLKRAWKSKACWF